MRRRFHFAVVIALVLANCSAFADTAEVGRRSAGWTWSPYISVPLFATALMYLVGVFRMRQRGGRVRSFWLLCFTGGWLSLLIALDSPVHEISEQLFWAHMTQHEVLMLISAPLLILSRPSAPFLFALPERWRPSVANIAKVRVVERAWLLICTPVAAWMLHALALWCWHAPKLFDATLNSDWVHAGQHISFLGTALLFWWTLIHNHAGRLGYGGAILYVFTTAIHTSVLGALLTFAPRAWYAPYAQTAPVWGLSGLQDQQIGGLVMWVPGGTLLTIVALVLVAKWLSQSDRRWEYTRTAALVRASQGAAE